MPAVDAYRVDGSLKFSSRGLEGSQVIAWKGWSFVTVVFKVAVIA